MENLRDAKRVLRYYVRRWECEEAIRFLKNQVNLEKIRTFRWCAIRRLVLLAVLVMIYLGRIVEAHPDIGDRLVDLRQPLPGKPDFFMYRLLTGLTEAINTCFLAPQGFTAEKLMIKSRSLSGFLLTSVLKNVGIAKQC